MSKRWTVTIAVGKDHYQSGMYDYAADAGSQLEHQYNATIRESEPSDALNRAIAFLGAILGDSK